MEFPVQTRRRALYFEDRVLATITAELDGAGCDYSYKSRVRPKPANLISPQTIDALVAANDLCCEDWRPNKLTTEPRVIGGLLFIDKQGETCVEIKVNKLRFRIDLPGILIFEVTADTDKPSFKECMWNLIADKALLRDPLSLYFKQKFKPGPRPFPEYKTAEALDNIQMILVGHTKDIAIGLRNWLDFHIYQYAFCQEIFKDSKTEEIAYMHFQLTVEEAQSMDLAAQTREDDYTSSDSSVELSVSQMPGEEQIRDVSGSSHREARETNRAFLGEFLVKEVLDRSATIAPRVRSKKIKKANDLKLLDDTSNRKKRRN